jgi:ATP-dependent Clp protease ATP-binding subunit ClpC
MRMFQRYTPQSRRAIYFAREAALHADAVDIESRHILLGLLVDQDSRANTVLRLRELSTEEAAVQRNLTRHSLPKDLRLAAESKRILAYASEEAVLLNDYWIDTDHLVLGILRERACEAAQLLNAADVRLEMARGVVSGKQSTRIVYGPLPFLWSLEKPISRIGRWAGTLYLIGVLVLIELLSQQYCTGTK